MGTYTEGPFVRIACIHADHPTWGVGAYTEVMSILWSSYCRWIIELHVVRVCWFVSLLDEVGRAKMPVHVLSKPEAQLSLHKHGPKGPNKHWSANKAAGPPIMTCQAIKKVSNILFLVSELINSRLVLPVRPSNVRPCYNFCLNIASTVASSYSPTGFFRRFVARLVCARVGWHCLRSTC